MAFQRCCPVVETLAKLQEGAAAICILDWLRPRRSSLSSASQRLFRHLAHAMRQDDHKLPTIVDSEVASLMQINISIRRSCMIFLRRKAMNWLYRVRFFKRLVDSTGNRADVCQGHYDDRKSAAGKARVLFEVFRNIRGGFLHSDYETVKVVHAGKGITAATDPHARLSKAAGCGVFGMA